MIIDKIWQYRKVFTIYSLLYLTTLFLPAQCFQSETGRKVFVYFKKFPSCNSKRKWNRCWKRYRAWHWPYWLVLSSSPSLWPPTLIPDLNRLNSSRLRAKCPFLKRSISIGSLNRGFWSMEANTSAFSKRTAPLLSPTCRQVISLEGRILKGLDVEFFGRCKLCHCCVREMCSNWLQLTSCKTSFHQGPTWWR